ncbi:MAG: flippase-like domain-containing protein, partial [Psychromonas sp.]|nr:flippase-like domain-containing protein [Psychromonas sp.]
MKFRSTLISVLTFSSVILLVQYIWGWTVLLSFWKVIPLAAIISFTLLYWFSYLIRSYRISIYFNSATVKLPTKTVFPLVVKQTFWANILPAKAGEISFPIFMKRTFDIPYSHSVPALLVLRLFDAYVLGSIAVAIFAYAFLEKWIFAWLIFSFFIPLSGITLRKHFIWLTYKYRKHRKSKF